MTGSVSADLLPKLAAMPRVSAIRLPRVTLPDVEPTTKMAVDTKAVLDKSGAAELHKAGNRGKGVRIAILDHDFRQWKKFVEAGKLPAGT